MLLKDYSVFSWWQETIWSSEIADCLFVSLKNNLFSNLIRLGRFGYSVELFKQEMFRENEICYTENQSIDLLKLIVPFPQNGLEM